MASFLLSGIMQQDNSEQVIINPRLIARHYIGTWFFLDLISSIPLDYIFLIFNSIRGSDVSFMQSSTSVGVLRTFLEGKTTIVLDSNIGS